MAKYQLKEGIELHPFGASSLINNENLTDEIAELLISKGLSLENFENQLEEKQTIKKQK